MKVLLIGIGGVYNYGCEAIVRGTVNILHGFFPDLEIDYASSNVKDDRYRLKNCDVNIILRKNKWAWWNIARKILQILHIPNNLPLENIYIIKKYNAVFSIGGDIYTIYQDGSYAKSLVQFGNECYRRGVPYILWGCSVGPFEKSRDILQIFKEHLGKLPLIVARESVTIDYLKTIGISNNVIFSYDPAFFVPSGEYAEVTKRIDTIGINLSPLSLSFSDIDKNTALLDYANLISKFVVKNKVKVILLPHVISPSKNDNDYLLLKSIYYMLDKDIQKNVELVDTDPGFIGLKAFLKKCNLIFTARMHCGINAICCGVPTVFLSYSEKSIGMARLLYGGTKMCIPLKDFNSDLDINDFNQIPEFNLDGLYFKILYKRLKTILE